MKYLIVFSLFSIISQSFNINPILLVPGLGGSQLTAQYVKSPPHYICGRQDKWFQLWLNIYFMLPITLNCFVDAIKLEYNATTKRTYSPDFCDISVLGFGTVDTISYLSNLKIYRTSYFYYLIEELVTNQGYKPGKSIRGAPYDFRKSPSEMEEFRRDLRNLVETMYKENGNQSVILLGHSLGTIYLNLMLNSETKAWKNTYVKAFISISGPYLGCVDALRTALSGNNEHIPIICPVKLRPAQSSWPSTYPLMPNPELWPNKPFVYTRHGYFTTSTISDLLELSKIPNAVTLYKNVNFIKNMTKAPEVHVHCIYTDNMMTSEVLDYNSTNFIDDQPIIKSGPGDGTVNLDSLIHCSNWKNYQKETVETTIIPDQSHINILRESNSVQRIIKIIKELNT